MENTIRCHYEVLGVPMDVDSQVLRSAYKKLALKWHPDKNLDNVEQAKEEFQLVQQAFEVLSDPQERAWYDAHRKIILKGGLFEDYQDDGINLFQYFTPSCYQGYGDDEKGFYTVYRDVFDKLLAEEAEFITDEEPDSFPTFGKSGSSYEEVVHPFYAYWENYSTKKTYAWLDKYDIRYAPNRRVVRFMEKQNRKLRDKAKKQRNEEIRQLVQFVRKRDKRLDIYRKYLEKKSAENAMKAQMNRLRQLEERKQEIAESIQGDWAKMHNVERELEEIENNLANEFGDHTSSDEMDGEDESESGVSHLYCVACNKIFKNEKSFINHESSKKHKENVAALHVPLEDDLDDSKVDKTCSNSDVEGKQEISYPAESSMSKKKAKTKKVLKPLEESYTNGKHSALDSADENGDDEDYFSKSKKQARKKNKKKNSKVLVQTLDIEVIEEPCSDSKTEDSQKQPQESGETEINNDKKQKKKKQTDVQNRKDNEESKAKEDFRHTCAVCNSTFPSKNKLFNHLETTGHSVYLPKSHSAREERSSKAKNKNYKC